jgi:hypothetical protein
VSVTVWGGAATGCAVLWALVGDGVGGDGVVVGTARRRSVTGEAAQAM